MPAPDDSGGDAGADVGSDADADADTNPALPFPLAGATLVTGASNTGKTRLTARALEAWVAERGTDGVVVLDFAPELERDDRLIGGHLERFLDIPEGTWAGVLEAHAPRSAGETEAETLALARENARRSTRLLAAAPAEPTAVFVNDATIPFQSGLDPARLTDYCSGAEAVVCNALEADSIGGDDPISRAEDEALAALHRWADRVVEL